MIFPYAELNPYIRAGIRDFPVKCGIILMRRNYWFILFFLLCIADELAEHGLLAGVPAVQLAAWAGMPAPVLTYACVRA